MNRGDRCEPIFMEDSDREVFLRTLAEACQKTNWQAHPFCLMPNHYGPERHESAEAKAERIVIEDA